MENKGLCITCIHDKECKFPVLQCEEFSSYESGERKQEGEKNKG
ncbi:MAG: hypothetical protein U9O59_00095 [Actinomycetota bacterium]|nr:hypothetical protein [Actinomycetota bacterium]